jgi:DNA-binding response OmpR family regulator
MKILIVEDSLSVCQSYRSALEPTHVILTATVVYDAQVFLDTNPDIDLVVLDGLVPMFRNGHPEKTLGLACRLEWRYPQIIVVAASSDEQINKELVDCGAHYAISNKSVAELQALLITLP